MKQHNNQRYAINFFLMFISPSYNIHIILNYISDSFHQFLSIMLVNISLWVTYSKPSTFFSNTVHIWTCHILKMPDFDSSWIVISGLMHSITYKRKILYQNMRKHAADCNIQIYCSLDANTELWKIWTISLQLKDMMMIKPVVFPVRNIDICNFLTPKIARYHKS